jgi:hypothetical protein
MSDEAQPLYSDEGEHVGWAVEAEDGAIVALDLDATGIVGAMDPGTGELIDHSAYELDDGADDGACAGYDLYAHTPSRRTSSRSTRSSPRPTAARKRSSHGARVAPTSSTRSTTR